MPTDSRRSLVERVMGSRTGAFRTQWNNASSYDRDQALKKSIYLIKREAFGNPQGFWLRYLNSIHDEPLVARRIGSYVRSLENNTTLSLSVGFNAAVARKIGLELGLNLERTFALTPQDDYLTISPRQFRKLALSNPGVLDEMAAKVARASLTSQLGEGQPMLLPAHRAPPGNNLWESTNESILSYFDMAMEVFTPNVFRNPEAINMLASTPFDHFILSEGDNTTQSGDGGDLLRFATSNFELEFSAQLDTHFSDQTDILALDAIEGDSIVNYSWEEVTYALVSIVSIVDKDAAAKLSQASDALLTLRDTFETLQSIDANFDLLMAGQLASGVGAAITLFSLFNDSQTEDPLKAVYGILDAILKGQQKILERLEQLAGDLEQTRAVATQLLDVVTQFREDQRNNYLSLRLKLDSISADISKLGFRFEQVASELSLIPLMRDHASLRRRLQDDRPLLSDDQRREFEQVTQRDLLTHLSNIAGHASHEDDLAISPIYFGSRELKDLTTDELEGSLSEVYVSANQYILPSLIEKNNQNIMRFNRPDEVEEGWLDVKALALRISPLLLTDFLITHYVEAFLWQDERYRSVGEAQIFFKRLEELKDRTSNARLALPAVAEALHHCLGDLMAKYHEFMNNSRSLSIFGELGIDSKTTVFQLDEQLESAFAKIDATSEYVPLVKLGRLLGIWNNVDETRQKDSYRFKQYWIQNISWYPLQYAIKEVFSAKNVLSFQSFESVGYIEPTAYAIELDKDVHHKLRKNNTILSAGFWIELGDKYEFYDNDRKTVVMRRDYLKRKRGSEHRIILDALKGNRKKLLKYSWSRKHSVPARYHKLPQLDDETIGYMRWLAKSALLAQVEQDIERFCDITLNAERLEEGQQNDIYREFASHKYIFEFFAVQGFGAVLDNSPLLSHINEVRMRLNVIVRRFEQSYRNRATDLARDLTGLSSVLGARAFDSDYNEEHYAQEAVGIGHQRFASSKLAQLSADQPEYD